MKSSSYPAAVEARKAASGQLDFYRSIMGEAPKKNVRNQTKPETKSHVKQIKIKIAK